MTRQSSAAIDGLSEQSSRKQGRCQFTFMVITTITIIMLTSVLFRPFTLCVFECLRACV